ncbi:ATP-binding protein [Streptosporangium sp. NPDC020145]|uniref:ATP-binding protein n=1 Tax=Streptosporangium sp. NPDC020145 TaxID=3154694 RepID=UPI00342F5EFB
MRVNGPIDHYGDTRPKAPHHTWQRGFPGKEISVPTAREWARGLLTGRIIAPVLDDILLLLSEVVTNAVTHSNSGHAPDGQVTVRMTYAPGDVHVQVTDDGSFTSAPTVRTLSLDEDGGRGLWLVNLLATTWGAHRGETTRSVWFRISGF